MIPVILKGPRGCIKVLAFLDDGSTVSLIDHKVSKSLGLHVRKTTVTLSGLNNTHLRVNVAGLIDCKISGIKNVETFDLKSAYAIDNLDLPSQKLEIENVNRYHHLQDLEINPLGGEVPRILLGQDNWRLIVSREIREDASCEIAASRTLLGWVIHGSLKSYQPKKHSLQISVVCSVNRDLSSINESDENLHDLVKSYFALETLGVGKVVRKNKVEEQALNILDKTTRYCNDYWETGLLWAQENPYLPNNYNSALSRLISLEKKLDREPHIANLYHKEIERLTKENYAVKVTNANIWGNFWYLPHFWVYNINKPDKVRLVFDAAHRFMGVSLNDVLLKGPDFLQPLFGVLLSFREKRIGIKGDIRDMFMRIKICEKDRNFQRFLWRGKNRSDPPQVYEMSSMIFGSKSSPCSAIFVKNKNAELFKDKFPASANALINNTYMDEYLESLDSVEEAKTRIKEVELINSHAGFKMHEWISNSPQIGKSSNAINLQSAGSEKALGLQWDTNKDVLNFDGRMEKIIETMKNIYNSPTKLSVLRTVMSIYDPLGFLNPFTIRAKILMQNIWRRGTGWDEPLSRDDEIEWKAWVGEFPEVKTCQIPRCLFEYDFSPVAVELHTFCDASEKAYAAVVYSRAIYKNGYINTRIIASKSYVAPLKPMTIPRLELQAAVVGAKLANTVLKESKIKFIRQIYWSDSRTVLCWIRSDPRSYHPFVANRLGELDELTDSASWRWISTEENPADDATKAKKLNFTRKWLWQNGPKFLCLDEKHWPQQPVISRAEFKEKTRLEAKAVVMTVRPRVSNLPDPERFISWTHLIGSTARLLVAIGNFLVVIGRGWSRSNYEIEDLLEAETLWIREIQACYYSREISALRNGESLPRDSHISQFTPFLCNDGLIRANGRTALVKNVDKFINNPVILNGNHRVVRLLIAHYHRLFHHANTNTVFNELRQKYFIIRARVALRSISAHCVICQLRRAKPHIPRMADLPQVRLDHGTNPFTNCGIDYFGPITVAIGRRREKRWGLLFTCLTMRAVHLEIADTLSADSAIMAIQRMTARRGQPSIFYSDNGTNFRGACEELKQELAALDKEKLIAYGNRVGSKWHFIPPSAPHMGGAWESLVKSVKRALYDILKTQTPREEVLRTAFAEAEHTVNSRPLTFVSPEVDDPEAITPNHLLFGASSRNTLPRRYEMLEGSPRKQWAFAQRLADEFWHRWRKEYLPSLIARAKWTSESPKIKVGDIVIIWDNLSPRNTWKKGVIQEVRPGLDGRIRSEVFKTVTGLLTHPVAKLVRLNVTLGIF